MNPLAWRRHPWLWVPAVAFLLVNLGFLAAYRLVLAEEAELGRGVLGRREAELTRMQELRGELEVVWKKAKETEDGLASFYSERLATEEAMLTAVIARVKELAATAGLQPAANINYEKEAIEQQGLIQRAILFRVEGTYEQLRQLVNFLELSESFLVLEEVALNSADDANGMLGIDLKISTMFSERPQEKRSGE